MEQYKYLPLPVNSIISSFDENKDLYHECARLVAELDQIGWTAEYGLDGQLHDLEKIT